MPRKDTFNARNNGAIKIFLLMSSVNVATGYFQRYSCVLRKLTLEISPEIHPRNPLKISQEIPLEIHTEIHPVIQPEIYLLYLYSAPLKLLNTYLKIIFLIFFASLSFGFMLKFLLTDGYLFSIMGSCLT